MHYCIKKRPTIPRICTLIPFAALLSKNWLKFKYSKALRCSFLGEWKKLCSSKFVQLELLNKAIARTLKNRAA